ncbi:hypothetical protein ACLOJK_007699 [Asimina triloba]
MNLKNKGLKQAYKQYIEENSKSSTLCQQILTGFANRVLSTPLFATEFCRVSTGFDGSCQQDPVDPSVWTEICRIPTDFDRFLQQGPVDHSVQARHTRRINEAILSPIFVLEANQVVKQINSTHHEEKILKAEIQTLMKKSNRFGFTRTDLLEKTIGIVRVVGELVETNRLVEPKNRMLIAMLFDERTGMGTLTLSASVPAFKPPSCVGYIYPSASPTQYAIFFIGLYIIALGIGGIKPCVSVIGASNRDVM